MEKLVYTFLILNLLFLQASISQSWHPITSDLYMDNGLGGNGGGSVLALQEYQDKLYIGGIFSQAGGSAIGGLAVWDGISWDSIFHGDSLTGSAEDFTVHENKLYMTGLFYSPTNPGSGSFDIATWDGVSLSKEIASPPINFSGSFDLTEVYNGELYAAGSWGGVLLSLTCCIARWNGSQWSEVGGSDADGSISSMAVYNGELYVGGLNLYNIGGVSVSNIARWGGITWKDVGGGVNGSASVMTVDSISNVLYVSVGGQGIWQWNGNIWTQISGGATGDAVPGGQAVIMYHGELYSGSGGTGSNSSGEALKNIARWNGTKWKPVGGGTNSTVRSFSVYRDTLYVGGYFTVAGTDSTYYLAKWFTDTTLGINEVGKDKYQMSVYPNPSKDSFTIEVTARDNQEIKIYGLKGDLVKHMLLTKGDTRLTIDTRGWNKGVYICELSVEGEKQDSKKIVVE